MTLVDWLIVIVLAASMLGGFTQGLFRSVFSLAGLVIGLVVAAWNYARLAALLVPLVRIDVVAEAAAFLVIAALVMLIFGVIGSVLHKTFHRIGLGCLDRLAGGFFGLLQGMLLVTLCILVAVAFFPDAHWLVQSRFPKFFFGVCHLSTQMTPAELAERLRNGLTLLERQSPLWMHPNVGKP